MINSNLLTVNWVDLFSGEKISFNVEKLYSSFNDLISTYLPLQNIQPSQYPDWFLKELLSKIILKKKLHKLWFKLDVVDDFIKFKRFRAVFLIFSKANRADYIKNVESSFKKKVNFFGIILISCLTLIICHRDVFECW